MWLRKIHMGVTLALAPSEVPTVARVNVYSTVDAEAEEQAG